MYNRHSEQSRDLRLTVVNSAVLVPRQSFICRLEPGLVGARDLKLGLRMMAMLLRRLYWVVRDMNEAVVGEEDDREEKRWGTSLTPRWSIE